MFLRSVKPQWSAWYLRRSSRCAGQEVKQRVVAHSDAKISCSPLDA